MHSAAVHEHRIWSHAALAAAACVLVPTLLVTIGWYLEPARRDSDMSGVHELILFFVLTLSIPALALSFGVLAPSAIIADRLTGGRTSRRLNLLLAPVIALPMVLAAVAFGAFLRSGWDLRELADSMGRPLVVAAEQPLRAVLTLAFFAVLGLIVALGMRHRSPRRLVKPPAT